MYLAKITTSSGRHELRSDNLAELVWVYLRVFLFVWAWEN
jgi:hypothetical protein